MKKFTKRIKTKNPIPKITFWNEVDGNHVLTQYVEKSLHAIKSPKILKSYLELLYNQMIKEAIPKNIYGVLLTQEPITIGAIKDTQGEFMEVKKKVMFDFEPKNASKGIFFY
jgi:hypothetical protein